MRSSKIALLSLSLIAAGLVWSTIDRSGPRAPSESALANTSPLPDSNESPELPLEDPGLPNPATAAPEIAVPSEDEPLGSRREAEPIDAREVSSPGLVRVHGQVRWAGRPVSDYDLAFQAAGEKAGETDWDFTDEDGRYEVLLPASSYAVLHDDEGHWVADVVVPEGRDELVLDFDLPAAPSSD